MWFCLSFYEDERECKVAKEDLTVYQILYEEKGNDGIKYFKDIDKQHFYYKVGVPLPKVNLKVKERRFDRFITFHIDEGYWVHTTPLIGYKNYRCIVPKGTKYYINTLEGDLAAETITLCSEEYLSLKECYYLIEKEVMRGKRTFNDWDFNYLGPSIYERYKYPIPDKLF